MGENVSHYLCVVYKWHKKFDESYVAEENRSIFCLYILLEGEKIICK